MGGYVSQKWNKLAKHLWHFCIQGIILVSTAYIPGNEIIAAD